MRNRMFMLLCPLALSVALAFSGDARAVEPPLAPAIAEIRDALRLGNIDAAVEASEAAVAQLGGSARAWWWAGRAYGQQAMAASLFGKAKWASRTREAFEKAVELDPAHVESRFDLMSYYLMAPSIVGGGRDKAEAQAAAIAGLDASMGKLAQARLAASDDESERAQALVGEALALDPDNRQARLMQAASAAERKDWAAVRALWQTQLARTRHHALARYQLGRTAAISGEELDDGLAQLDSFIAAGEVPEELTMAAAYWRRGQILDKLGRRDEAIESLQRAVDDRNIGEQAAADLKRIRTAG